MSKPQPTPADEMFRTVHVTDTTRPQTDDPDEARDRWRRSIAWQQSRHDRPRISWHAQQRWDQRTPWWSSSVEYAYDCSVPLREINVNVFQSNIDDGPDRVKLFGEHTEHGFYAALLYIRDDCMTTVIRVEDMTHSPPLKAYFWYLLIHRGHLELESEPHEGRQNV